ncbi:MAG: tail fiber protein [Pseudomonadota bacterium]
MKTVKQTLTTLAATAVIGAAFMAKPNAAMAGSDPFIGEIQPAGYNFCPRGWALADGQLLAIASNNALFSLLGTQFGGDGRTTFALPDLRGRVPVHAGTGPGLTNIQIAQKRGAETASLTSPNQIATHSHNVKVNNNDSDKGGPGSKLLGANPPGGRGNETIYNTQPANVQMAPEMIEFTGNGAAFSTLDPSLTIRYCIALQGIFPSRN